MNNHKKIFMEIKGALEGLYSIHNRTQDQDLDDATKLNIQTHMYRADAAITNYNGALKGMKITVEPCQQLHIAKSGSLDLLRRIALGRASESHPRL